MTNSEKTGYRKRPRKGYGTEEVLKAYASQTASTGQDRVFEEVQCVSPSVVTKNKRLAGALAVAKAWQKRNDVSKTLANNERNGHKKIPDRVYGPEVEMKRTAPGAD
jgi:hypothetical protein